MARWKAALTGLTRGGLRLIYPDVCQLCHGEVVQPEDDYIEARCFVPVPIHAVHFSEHWFNQAGQLCRNLGRATGLMVETRVVKRTRVTRIQTLIARGERMVKMLVAFAPYRQNLNGRRVVLVDDVFDDRSHHQRLLASLQKSRRSGGWRVDACLRPNFARHIT